MRLTNCGKIIEQLPRDGCDQVFAIEFLAERRKPSGDSASDRDI
jgi:hypothetical protein